MIKSLLLVVFGAVAALEIDKRMESVRSRISPRAITDSALDRLNNQLERKRGAQYP